MDKYPFIYVFLTYDAFEILKCNGKMNFYNVTKTRWIVRINGTDLLNAMLLGVGANSPFSNRSI